MINGPWSYGHFGHLVINFLATVLVAAFIPSVFRRLGPGYGVFVVGAVLVTAVSTKVSSAWVATAWPPSPASLSPPTSYPEARGWLGAR